MFRSARIRLTLWYLLIIMTISVSFSLVIFRMLSTELDRIERAQQMRNERLIPDRVRIVLQQENEPPWLDRLDPEIIKETKDRLMVMLLLVNLGILGASTVLGYFLAGKTLHPIQQMVDEQNQFVTDASHELRTPLTALKSSIEVALRGKNQTQETNELLKSNLEDVNNLQILSDGLIRLSQYEKGENGFPIGPVSLKEITDTAVKKLQHQAKEKHIRIAASVKDGTVEGNASALGELITILLDNAVKYSPKHTTVTVSSEKNDGSVVFRVIDEGVGIDEKDMPHIFDRFYRADKSRTKTRAGGYGLGLAIAKQIVDRHHGTISAEANKPKGTVFTVVLSRKHRA